MGTPGTYQAPPRTLPQEPPTFRFAFTATVQVKHWNGYGDTWRPSQGSKPAEVTVTAPDLAAAEAKALPLLYELRRDFRWQLKAHTIEEVQ
jgi:hypothetical protein